MAKKIPSYENVHHSQFPTADNTYALLTDGNEIPENKPVKILEMPVGLLFLTCEEFDNVPSESRATETVQIEVDGIVDEENLVCSTVKQHEVSPYLWCGGVRVQVGQNIPNTLRNGKHEQGQ